MAGHRPPAQNPTGEDEFASLNSILLTTTLLLLIFVGYRINTNRLRHVPESGCAMIMGFVLGLIVRVAGLKEELQLLQFKGSVFFYVLLPPIILEAGLALETQMFVDNLGSIFAFAVIGTLVSAWVTSRGLYLGAELGMIGLDGNAKRLAIHCHLFGALISATDPVATIALFGGARFRTDPLLHSLINGESVLNDAVAIALFVTLSQHIDEDGPQLFSASVLGSFFLVSTFSLALGLAAGAFCSWCFCRAQSLATFPDYEISAMWLGAYLTFAFAQLVGLSGIVALFFFGVVLAQYNFYNLSERSKVASQVTFGTMAKLAESCVFIYLGVVAALSMGRYHWHLGLVLYTCVLITIARAAHIFPLTGLLNFWRVRKINRNMSVVMWVSGLRGAIAFALSLRLPCAAGTEVRRGTEECKNSDMLVTTTISIVMLTTLGVGTAMERFMTVMGMLEIVPPGGADSPRASRDRSYGDALSGSDSSAALAVPLAARGTAEEGRHIAARDGGDAAGGIVVVGGVDVHEREKHAVGFAGRSARSLLNARGWVYQAFARFDLNYLQPALGGPCRGRGVDTAIDIVELPNLPQPPDWTPPEPPPPDWSRAAIFE